MSKAIWGLIIFLCAFISIILISVFTRAIKHPCKLFCDNKCNVDCVGSYGTCNIFCKKHFTITTPAIGDGKPCEEKPGWWHPNDPNIRVVYCNPDEDLTDECYVRGPQEPDADCIGAWSACDANCKKKYTISRNKFPGGSGAPCEAVNNATMDCNPDDDLTDAC